VLDAAGETFCVVHVGHCIGGDHAGATSRARRIAEALNNVGGCEIKREWDGLVSPVHVYDASGKTETINEDCYGDGPGQIVNDRGDIQPVDLRRPIHGGVVWVKNCVATEAEKFGWRRSGPTATTSFGSLVEIKR
jgi:hypothetical protein